MDGSSKTELRKTLREAQERAAATSGPTDSAKACRLLLDQDEWRKARWVLGYAPVSTELNLWSALMEGWREGKKICLPRYNEEKGGYEAACVVDVDRDLVTGRFGIREPARDCPEVPLKQLDLVLVPGLGFDMRGRRLGKGKGYYDRLLPDAGGWLCGFGFECQIVDEIPTEPHDYLVDCILTPVRWVLCGQRPG